MNIESIREFLGWCTLINVGILWLTTAIVAFCPGFLLKLHHKLFGLDESSLRMAYYNYLMYLKIAVIIFNLVPYVVLLIMSSNPNPITHAPEENSAKISGETVSAKTSATVPK